MGIAGVPGPATGRLHHLEIWVSDHQQAKESLGWLLEQCGYVLSSEWDCGGSWQGAAEYIVLESGAHATGTHERRRAGLMFADRHPYAGGPKHYAAYLENSDGFEVELVAAPGPGISPPG